MPAATKAVFRPLVTYFCAQCMALCHDTTWRVVPACRTPQQRYRSYLEGGSTHGLARGWLHIVCGGEKQAAHCGSRWTVPHILMIVPVKENPIMPWIWLQQRRVLSDVSLLAATSGSLTIVLPADPWVAHLSRCIAALRVSQRRNASLCSALVVPLLQEHQLRCADKSAP